MKLQIQVREPLGNMVYFPQFISEHITYNKQMNMSEKMENFVMFLQNY